ncbi:MAG: hypothetical protein Q9215_001874 [Flavoplaca cf. flavocitrina]
MGGQLFSGLVIAAAGDFGPLRSHLVLQQWVEKRGGFWSNRITYQTTHLLCTKEAFRGKVNMESNMAGYLKPAQGGYLVKQAIRTEKERKKLRRLTKEITIQREHRYHIYRDITGFAYNIILVRPDVLRNSMERCILKLCSTLETPKGYTCLMIHHVPGKDPETVHLTNKRCDWFTALAAFEKAFKDSTKVDWDDRQVVKSADKDAFEYVRPKTGAPIGFLINDVFCR